MSNERLSEEVEMLKAHIEEVETARSRKRERKQEARASLQKSLKDFANLVCMRKQPVRNRTAGKDTASKSQL